MSTPDIVKGTYVSVLVEEPAGSGTFVPLCGMTTRTLTEQVNTNDVFVRDCEEPEEAPFRRLVKTGKQWDMSASGLYNRALKGLVKSLVGATRLYRYFIGEPVDDAVYSSFFEGPAMLTQRQITGGDEDFVQSELTWASDGEWVEAEVD